jgi:hypothetical protein
MGQAILKASASGFEPANTYDPGHLRNFVQALARNQARIDHAQAMNAANDNTRH